MSIPIVPGSDTGTWKSWMNTIVAAIQALFNARADQTYRWADATARAAQTGMVVGNTGYQSDTGITYRYNGSAWDLWESGWITWATAPTNLTVGTGGSAGTVQRYKYINGRIWFECAYTLGTSGQSVGTNPQINLPFSIAMLGGVNGGMLLGDGIVYDAAPGAAVSNFVKAIQITASTVFPRTYNGTVTAISATAPITFAAGDKIAVGFWGDPA